jgi:2-polyprenyl-3-methyl-5-hydroxy-6-metoxy-1,4-benzoquinol methylase
MSLRSVIHRAALGYVQWLCKQEFRQQTFERLNERSVEYAFVFRQVARYQPHSILDVGAGATALPHLLRTCGAVVTAIDNVRDFWPSGMVNRHWYVLDDDIRASRLEQRFDLITCVSVLEHIPEHERAVVAMLGLLAPGGHLLLTAPYNERGYCPNVYDLPGSEVSGRVRPPYATQAFSRHELDGWLAAGARLVEQEHWCFYDGEYWTVGARMPVPRQVETQDRHQIGCLLLERS